MGTINDNNLFLKELTSEEARLVNGGEPGKSTSFYYDLFYTVSHLVGDAVQAVKETEIFTYQFWVEWGYAVL